LGRPPFRRACHRGHQHRQPPTDFPTTLHTERSTSVCSQSSRLALPHRCSVSNESLLTSSDVQADAAPTAEPPRRVRRLTDLRLSRRLVSVVESSRTSPARQLGHRRSLRSNYPHALRFYRSDAPEKLRISGLRGKRLRRKASERQSHDERSASHTDDREISDTVERIKVLILCYDRQVLRGSDRRDPQIVDPDAATRLGEMDAQQCPQSGRFLVHR
jgi:hypothetical protein